MVFFTTRRYASAVYVVVCLRLFVRPSVCMYVTPLSQRHTIAQGLEFSDAKYLGEITTGLPPTGAPKVG